MRTALHQELPPQMLASTKYPKPYLVIEAASDEDEAENQQIQLVIDGIISEALMKLSDKEREVIVRSCGLLGYTRITRKQIASEMKITEHKVGDLKSSALARLKEHTSFTAQLLPYIAETRGTIWKH